MYKSHFRVDTATSDWLIAKVGRVQLLQPSRSEEVVRLNIQWLSRYLLFDMLSFLIVSLLGMHEAFQIWKILENNFQK